jgi:hypothetical protein
MNYARIALILIAGLGPAAALAQEAPPSSGGAFIGRLFDATGLRSPAPQAQDFVRASRPERLEYRAFDPTPPKDPKKKSAADVRALAAGLEAAAAENRRRAAGVARPEAPAKPAR